MIFHARQKNIDFINLDIQLENIRIERVSTFNFLGLTLNEYMSWESHINKVAIKISRITGLFNRLKHFLPTDIMKTLYSTLIESHLHFGILTWGFERSRLLNIQKKAVRLILNKKYNAHTEPIFKSLKILKLDDIFKRRVLQFFYKYKNQSLPEFLLSLSLFSNTSTLRYQFRHRLQYQPNPTKKRSTDKCLRNYVAILLNETPNCIIDKVNTHSYQGFSSYIKDYYLNEYALIYLLDT